VQMILSSTEENRPGHYSLAVECNNFVFVSGQLPMDWSTKQMVSGGIEIQARQALNNLQDAVQRAGLSLTDIVKVTVYINGIEHWPVIDNIYAEYFKEHRPSRSIVPTLALHYGAQIEIEAIAYREAIPYRKD